MKQMLYALVPLLAAAAFTYYINQKGPDLRYQLSRPIPMETEGTASAKVVQQIEIANVGKAVAQKLQVKIKKAVGKLTVLKDSQSDNYARFDAAGSTELMYDSLQPSGRVQIVLSGGEPLAEQDVEVRHLQGPARLALTSQASPWSWLPASLLTTFSLLYLWLSARAFAREHFRSISHWDPAAILRRKKPPLVSDDEWMSILADSAGRMADKELGETSDVSSWRVYRLLNSNKPERLADAAWDKILPAMIDGFTSRVEATASTAHVYGNLPDIRKLLVIPKPSALFDEPWTRLLASLSARYVAALEASDFTWDHPPSLLVKRLAETKPDGVLERDWEGHQGRVRSLYFALSFRELSGTDKPMERMKSLDLTSLSDFESKILKTFAYHREMEKVPSVCTPHGANRFLNSDKPNFMSEADYESLAGTAQTVKRATEDERRYSALFRQITGLLNASPLAVDMPEGISTDDWAGLKRIEQTLVATPKETERRHAELVQREAEASTLKAKVLRQLEVINTFISDPDVLSRIEDYDGVFAPGNLANLRSLAALRQPAPTR
jgi:hypothetical protein